MTSGGGIAYIGCYTAEGGGRGEGVAAARRDPETGLLDSVETVAVTPSPSFLARHPTLPVLYAVNELAEGTVTAWQIGDRTRLTELAVRDTGGDSPAHLAVAPDGRHLYAANYASGSVSVHPLDGDGVPAARSDLVVHDGHGVDPQRQERAHAHFVIPDGPAVLYAVDLGTDTVYRYELDPAAGRLLPRGRTHVRPGTGPRHLARRPDVERWYLSGELDGSVSVLARGGDGGLEVRDRVAASERSGHVQPAEIAVSADGRHLYVSNRGVGTISVFALDGDGPPVHRAEVSSGGTWPRHFALAGDRLYVADERAHRVTCFAVSAETGVPAPVGEPLEVGSPTCVLPWI
ncbi:lactonase family protein [Plantactinospora sp. KBS50]|uniref:lactonase family protein n=1 Tax=Plantactinospora sp. KBS50 TaxID=2024580 RepID=UPI000BAB0DDC|nr:lactonase family protein [Plantactinospora sp. KBS50]ASW56396.1 3-carboxymuconate cyclase [Plantactinospora sp. KBS50]